MSIEGMVARSATQTPARRRRKHHFSSGYFLILPYAAWMLLFGIAPAGYALVFSLSKFELGKPQYFQAGLSNFIRAYTDYRFLPALQNVLVYVALSVPIGIIGALILALLLHSTRDRLNGLMRTIYFLPGSVTGSVLVLIFIFMLDPKVSPFGFLMSPFGWQVQQDVITKKSLQAVFTLIAFFSHAGGWIAIFYGALNGISRELMEAAEIDGCTAWQLAWHIKRPLIMTYVWYMLITLFVASMQIYVEPALISSAMFDNSPVTPYWSLNQLAAQITLLGADFGASGAISLLQVAISLVAAYLVIAKTDFYRTDVAD